MGESMSNVNPTTAPCPTTNAPSICSLEEEISRVMNNDQRSASAVSAEQSHNNNNDSTYMSPSSDNFHGVATNHPYLPPTSQPGVPYRNFPIAYIPIALPPPPFGSPHHGGLGPFATTTTSPYAHPSTIFNVLDPIKRHIEVATAAVASAQRQKEMAAAAVASAQRQMETATAAVESANQNLLYWTSAMLENYNQLATATAGSNGLQQFMDFNNGHVAASVGPQPAAAAAAAVAAAVADLPTHGTKFPIFTPPPQPRDVDAHDLNQQESEDEDNNNSPDNTDTNNTNNTNNKQNEVKNQEAFLAGYEEDKDSEKEAYHQSPKTDKNKQSNYEQSDPESKNEDENNQSNNQDFPHSNQEDKYHNNSNNDNKKERHNSQTSSTKHTSSSGSSQNNHGNSCTCRDESPSSNRKSDPKKENKSSGFMEKEACSIQIDGISNIDRVSSDDKDNKSQVVSLKPECTANSDEYINGFDAVGKSNKIAKNEDRSVDEMGNCEIDAESSAGPNLLDVYSSTVQREPDDPIKTQVMGDRVVSKESKENRSLGNKNLIKAGLSCHQKTDQQKLLDGSGEYEDCNNSDNSIRTSCRSNKIGNVDNNNRLPLAQAKSDLQTSSVKRKRSMSSSDDLDYLRNGSDQGEPDDPIKTERMGYGFVPNEKEENRSLDINNTIKTAPPCHQKADQQMLLDDSNSTSRSGNRIECVHDENRVTVTNDDQNNLRNGFHGNENGSSKKKCNEIGDGSTLQEIGSNRINKGHDNVDDKDDKNMDLKVDSREVDSKFGLNEFDTVSSGSRSDIIFEHQDKLDDIAEADGDDANDTTRTMQNGNIVHARNDDKENQNKIPSVEERGVGSNEYNEDCRAVNAVGKRNKTATEVDNEVDEVDKVENCESDAIFSAGQIPLDEKMKDEQSSTSQKERHDTIESQGMGGEVVSEEQKRDGQSIAVVPDDVTDFVAKRRQVFSQYQSGVLYAPNSDEYMKPGHNNSGQLFNVLETCLRCETPYRFKENPRSNKIFLAINVDDLQKDDIGNCKCLPVGEHRKYFGCRSNPWSRYVCQKSNQRAKKRKRKGVVKGEGQERKVASNETTETQNPIASHPRCSVANKKKRKHNDCYPKAITQEVLSQEETDRLTETDCLSPNGGHVAMEVKKDVTGLSQLEDDEDEVFFWVQCDNCDKWWKLNSDVDPDSLPDKWYCCKSCENNAHDSKRNSCEVREDPDFVHSPKASQEPSKNLKKLPQKLSSSLEELPSCDSKKLSPKSSSLEPMSSSSHADSENSHISLREPSPATSTSLVPGLQDVSKQTGYTKIWKSVTDFFREDAQKVFSLYNVRGDGNCCAHVQQEFLRETERKPVQSSTLYRKGFANQIRLRWDDLVDSASRFSKIVPRNGENGESCLRRLYKSIYQPKFASMVDGGYDVKRGGKILQKSHWFDTDVFVLFCEVYKVSALVFSTVGQPRFAEFKEDHAWKNWLMGGDNKRRRQPKIADVHPNTGLNYKNIIYAIHVADEDNMDHYMWLQPKKLEDINKQKSVGSSNTK